MRTILLALFISLNAMAAFIPTLPPGQATMAASNPVVIASNQSAFTINAAQSGAWTITSISGSISLPTGASTSALQSTGNASLVSIDSKLSSPISVTGPLTDAQLRASAVPVSVSNFPGTQPVSGTVTANQGGTWNINNISGTISLPTGAATAANQATGNASLSSIDSKLTSPLIVNGSGFTQPISAVSMPLPTGAASSANQLSGNGSLSSIDGKTPALVSGRVPVDGSGVTQPISGTVTANAGTNLNTSSLALNSTLTNRSQLSQITDGTRDATIKATNLAAIAADTSLVVGLSPNSPLPTGSNVIGSAGRTWVLNSGTDSVTVAGAITATNPSVSATGAAIPASATMVGGSDGANLRAIKVSATGVVSVDGSATTQPVSGNLGRSWTLSSGTDSISAAVSNFPATQAVTQSTSPWVISGTVTANNASVSGTGVAPPSSATYIGGSVTTAAPSYTTGQMNALSLTTAGLLRVDNSAVTQTVTGTVTANQGGTWNINNISGTISLPAGAATSALQASGNISLTSIDSKLTAPLAVTGPLTDAQLRATPVPVSGTVTASNPSVSATGAAFPASATHIGGSVTTAAPSYTNGQMSALSLSTAGLLRVDGSGSTQPVSGTVTANQGGTWNINNISGIISLPTGAATSALQTTGNSSLSSIDGKIPSSLTVTATRLLVDGSGVTQPVSGTVTANIGTIAGVATETTLSAINAKVPALGQALAAASVPVVLTAAQISTLTPLSTVAVTQSTSPWVTSISGTVPVSGPLTDTQLRATPVPVSGTLAVTQSTSPWVTSASQSGTWTVQPGNTANTTAWLVTGTGGTFPATQSGAWTVTANAGTNLNTSALALSATQTDRSQKSQITDGTRDGTVKAASTAAIAADTSLVVAMSPNSPLPTGSNIIGALTANQSVNVAQINGVTPLMGNGVTGTGSQRVTIASDNTPFAVGNTQGSTTSGQSGPLVQGAVTTAAPAYTTAQTSPLSLTTTGDLRVQVQGSVASGSADSGNPVKIGAVYNATLSSVTTGNRTNLQTNAFGELAVRPRNKFSNVTGNTTSTVKSGAGVFDSICFNQVGANGSTFTIYDNTAGSGTIIATIAPATTNNSAQCMEYEVEFATGLTVVTTGSANNNITITFQ